MLKQMCRRMIDMFGKQDHGVCPAEPSSVRAAGQKGDCPLKEGAQSPFCPAALSARNVAQVAEDFYTPVFDFDGLRTNPAVMHNHDFMKDPRFVRAYARGIEAQGADQKYYWRAHTALWCAAHANKLDGDFVECGVWKGFLASAIMRYLDWNSLDRRFFLFDTFCGIDESQVTQAERGRLHLEHYRKHYLPNYEAVQRNFAEFQNVTIIKGSVPGSLARVAIDRVAYLSLDMNNVTPEVCAAEYFWEKLVPGGVILLDDYGFVSYEEQKKGFDLFAQRKGVEILALPTGQGMIVKPPVERFALDHG